LPDRLGRSPISAASNMDQMEGRSTVLIDVEISWERLKELR
jgi:hypothetical protein